MKTKILFALALLISFFGFTQNNGWYLYDKPLDITVITPDDTNVNELHLGTNMGYIKYNTATNMVTGFLNITSQNPAIAKVKDLALNPTNNTIAFTMPGAVVIYDGTTVTKYTYQNSGLTLGATASIFSFLEVEYGVNGELYIFKTDVFGYQIFNNGVFETEVVTTFKPQDIIENQAGTKVFFAGWNDGLWELEKSTSTFTNYTISNSSLAWNALNALFLDSNGDLFIGSNRGLNRLTPAGVWSTYQQLIPPFNVMFYPVGSIHKNSSGDVLVDTSVNNAGQGITVVDLGTNTWTNYGNDNINCLNESFINAVAYGNNDNIYVSNKFPAANTDALDLFLFDPVANTCTVQNINYLNAMVTSTFNVADFNMRKKLSGTYDIGFTKFGDLYQFNIDPTAFAGGFPNVTTLTPAIGQLAYSLLSDNAFFIVENDAGWVFIDDANNVKQFNHNLPSYLAIITKKAAAFDSSNGIINLVHKGFDAAFNYRVYKTQCNTATTTCSVPEEIFTNNRDFTQNILFGADQDPTTGQVSVVAVKTGSAAAGSATKSFGGNFYRTNVSWDGSTNGIHINGWDEIHDVVPLKDPTHSIKDQFSIFIPSTNSISIRTEHPITGNPVITNLSSPHSSHFIDWESIELIFPGTDVNPIVEIMASLEAEPGRIDGSTQLFIDESYVNLGGVPNMVFTQISDATIDNDLPNDLFITKVIMKQYSLTEAFLMMLTNYGILLKTGIDISNLVLSTDDVSLKDASLLLYPNPANDMVSFSNNSIKTIAVYDINGRKVLSTTNSNSFSVKTLAQGIYIVKGTSDNNVIVTKKLIVE